ncbi:metal-dependent hydrolase [Candidatus Woesearchaeota archaeon]|jgi:membrane-bound metal-dependent hydrolase YbcI (DUF457 family)|nr:metal-dependent hydrolase [Candidatus Woesearchaeota archaeon]MBT7170133.1 metal-dependent hydrolase [Candidatus Woesearchaeota archaeon]MBT7474365.1 metal-dependent hydrolase [Candidatus Woesearchaeota archaeon]
MSLAFGHLTAAWIVGEIIQKISNKKLPNHAWALLLLGGIIPDIDFIFQILLNEPIHRTMTHSLFFALFSLMFIKNNKYKLLFTIGILVHIFLDLLTAPGVQLLWPLNIWISLDNYLPTTIMQLEIKNIPLVMADMFLGFFWFVYLFMKGKINF